MSADLGISPLQRQLEYVRQHPDEPWLLAIENVPTWPQGPPVNLNVARPSAMWQYERAQGLPELLEEICKREQARGRKSCLLDNLLVTHGGMHALGLTFRFLKESGYLRLICQAPILRSVYDLALGSGLNPVLVSTSLLEETISAYRSDDHLAIYLCTPHNPTGEVLGEAQLARIAQLTASRATRLIVDSVYDSFVFSRVTTEQPTLPIDSEQVLLINSMSKNYGAPGIRVGWICTDPASIRRLTARMEYETIAVSGVSQALATSLIRHGNAELIDAVIRGRQEVLSWWRNSNLGNPLTIDGGTQAWIPLPLSADADDFSNRLMARYRLVVASSANYAGATRPHLRIPLGRDPYELAQVIGILDRMLSSQ